MQRIEQSTSNATRDTKSPLAPPSISLPKGGGAIRGIGEKFGANVSTGTGSLSVPLALSPSRSGFAPQLSLSYDSGAGNGPFGLGWSLSLPSITRKTDQGLPRYNDVQDSDVFIISGAEDLVPVLVEEAGQWSRQPIERTVDGINYRIENFRPRIEGLFARIERWTNLQNGVIHWRSITQENITSIYGRDNNSRIFDPTDPDPQNPTRIFCWLISESFDDKGNIIVYQYKEENTEALPTSDVNERNRSVASRAANRYLKRIRYGNRVSRLVDAEAALNDWMFEVVFDYGEHDADNPAPDNNGVWLCRHDPFSAYRAGFEVRSYRLCQRVLMFHHFPNDEAVGQNCLVRSTDFTYRNIRDNPDDLKRGHPIASFLASITQCGYRRQLNGFLRRTLPPVEFEYVSSVVHEELRELELESLENLPYGIDGSRYQWLDLDGEGASGIITEQEGGWFYKRNLSPLNARRQQSAEAVLAPVELLASKPSLNNGGVASQLFLDLAGDGQVDLVQFGRPSSGYFERSATGEWSTFVPFQSVPSVSVDDPNVKFVDLTGDGHADLLISEDDVFVWYQSLGETGFAPGTKVAQALNEEEGPRLVFSDASQSIYLADLSGDGLTDLVRVRNGEVCYWPNLGYGKFGARVTMDNSPWFEEPDQFDQKRVLLADIDGSGLTDILYVARDRVDLFFNQSGNGWSEPHPLNQVPAANSLSSVAAVDLLGNGTACLVWSSSLAGERSRSLRYLDLMGGQKPHLLNRVVNNLGVETRVQYASSTSFYMEDKFAGRPWLTKLPFPVYVVDRLEVLDHVSRNRFVTRYTYHHGYFDGTEREFRGFGMVEQFDTEELAALIAEGVLAEATNIDASSQVPPVVTRTWFHTGALVEAGRISRQFEDEYYQEGDASLGEAELNEAQLRMMLLDDTILPNSIRLPDGSRLPWAITAEDVLEASRSLKGAVLRQEVYALDDSEAMDRPYNVLERNYTIEMLQPRGTNQNAVFFTHGRQTIDFQYERRLFDVNGRMLADPRVVQTTTLAVDTFGNTTESVAIAYGRRHPDPNPLLNEEDHQTQRQTLITHALNRFTNAVLEVDSYRAPVLAESQTYELLNLVPAANQPHVTNLFHFEEMLSATDLLDDGLHDIPYENVFAEGVDGPSRRLIEHTRSIYRSDDLSNALPLGELQTLAIPFETYQLAFTGSLLDQVYGDRVTDEMLHEGGYVHLAGDDNWWIPSGRPFFSPNPADTPAPELAHAVEHFFLPQRFADPFGNVTIVTYDANDLLVTETRNALDNIVRSRNDYRVLQPRVVTDPNGNQSAAAYDALGFLVGTALMGKENEAVGDSLDGFISDLDEETINTQLQDPLESPEEILGSATSRMIYELHSYRRTSASDNPQPNVVYELKRETHNSDLLPNQLSNFKHALTYYDGFGREIQKKIQAEPGPISQGQPIAETRWIGSGWTSFNNKGQRVRSFEPFFSATHAFEFAHTVGVSATIFYDPVGRIVGTLQPNHTREKVVFDPWRQETWDFNDTILHDDPRTDPDVANFFERLPETDYLPSWHSLRSDGQFGDTPAQRQAEQSAAEGAAIHANTPEIAWFDSLGRAFLTIVDNRFEREGTVINEQYATRFELDIEGLQREIRDARDRLVMRYNYDLAGRQIHSASMDAGELWTLTDLSGATIRKWDPSGHIFRIEYDELRRATRSFVTAANAEDPDHEILYQQTTYGEQEGEAFNHRGRVFQVFDSAGIETNEAYDFKGNLVRRVRRLLVNYREVADWNIGPALETETFATEKTYDALNRPIALTMADDSRIQPAYNVTGLLERVEVNLRGADEATVFVNNIDYDAKGQRELIEYGNGVSTNYTYERETFRLHHLSTLRGNEALQDLSYTYDPVGNVTSIRDDAQQATFFNNQVVDANAEYIYDSIYRLIETSGREHIGQAALPQTTWNDEFRIRLPHPNDGQAMRRYAQRYEYDEVGNILRLVHEAANGDWNRQYGYNEPNTIEPAQFSNRLTHTQVGGLVENYTHDPDGNMTRMPHLPLLRWNFLNELVATSQQVVNEGTPETTYYVYGAAGQRIRKVTDRQAELGQTPSRRNETIYLKGFEVFREYAADGVTTTLQRESLHVMDDQQRIALVETRTAGDEDALAQLIRFQLTNHLGSAALELDETGSVITYEEYYPYGSTSYQAGRNLVEVSRKRYRHSGKERDEETGLTYHGARYYASWLGRWTAADPEGFVDGLNVYQYVKGTPVGLVDPSGRFGDPPPKGSSNPSKARIVAGRLGELLSQQPDREDISPPEVIEQHEPNKPPSDDPPKDPVPKEKGKKPGTVDGKPKPDPPRLDERYPNQVDVPPRPSGTTPNQLPQHDLTQKDGTGALRGSIKAGPPLEPLPSPKRPTPPKKTTTPNRRPKRVRRMKSVGLGDRIIGPVIAGLGGIATYMDTGDAKAAVKETIKTTIESISPLPSPDDRVVMQVEQLDLPLVYYGSLPDEVDQEAQRRAQEEQSRIDIERLSRPGLVGSRRSYSSSAQQSFDPRKEIDRDIIRRIIDQHRRDF